MKINNKDVKCALNEQHNADFSSAEVLTNSSEYIPVEEQECHINDARDLKHIDIDSSNSLWNTKLLKLPNFKVVQVVVSQKGNKILVLIGTVPKKTISLRSVTKWQI